MNYFDPSHRERRDDFVKRHAVLLLMGLGVGEGLEITDGESSDRVEQSEVGLVDWRIELIAGYKNAEGDETVRALLPRQGGESTDGVVEWDFEVLQLCREGEIGEDDVLEAGVEDQVRGAERDEGGEPVHEGCSSCPYRREVRNEVDQVDMLQCSSASNSENSPIVGTKASRRNEL